MVVLISQESELVPNVPSQVITSMAQVHVKSAMLTQLVGLVRVLLPTNVQPVNLDIISPLLEVMVLMDLGVLVPNPVWLLKPPTIYLVSAYEGGK